MGGVPLLAGLDLGAQAGLLQIIAQAINHASRWAAAQVDLVKACGPRALKLHDQRGQRVLAFQLGTSPSVLLMKLPRGDWNLLALGALPIAAPFDGKQGHL